jgi:hypothetical protein
LTITLIILAAVGWTLGLWAAYGLWRWERQLTGARMAVAYKGKRVQMQPTLYEMLQWALRLDRDKLNNGQVFYRNGNVTLAILKPAPKTHGQAETKQIKVQA